MLITTELYEKAIEELVGKARQKYRTFPEESLQEHAKRLFHPSWHAATKAHESHMVSTKVAREERQRRPSVLNDPTLDPELRKELERHRTRIQENFVDPMFEMFEKHHRNQLILFFTGEDGISQQLAEQIVDQCIMEKIEA